MTADVIKRRMAGQSVGDVSLSDTVVQTVGKNSHVTLFFRQTVTAEQLKPPTGAMLLSQQTVEGASALTFLMPAATDPVFQYGRDTFHLAPAKAEQDLFVGKNAIVATRNGESAATVLDWLDYHVAHHQLEGVVLLDRAAPGTDSLFTAQLDAGLQDRNLNCRIVVIDSDLPLGKHDLPAEAHPFNVPGAPGKDRMKVPDADLWLSPFAPLNWFEIIRLRFLGTARAVANIDVHDLLIPGEQTVFDKAIEVETGVIGLVGRNCYPWRAQDVQNPKFADHICVQFDADAKQKRWCVAPAKTLGDTAWRLLRISNASFDPNQSHSYFRHMALRHPTDSVSKIVPKTSLIEDQFLLDQARKYFRNKPVRAPKVKTKPVAKGRGRRAIVTTMKNEGPFILEWLAYHRAIGFDDILVYTNDCTDGTNTMLDMLMRKGIVEHRQNQFRKMGLKPQHAALQMADEEPVIQNAKWVSCIDVDEYVNIKTGDGTLDALFAAVPDVNLISMTWRLFGNDDIHPYEDKPVTEQFQRCAPVLARKPHQAWGFKTLFLNNGIFKKLGVHRPKGLNPQLWDSIRWVNGSGQTMPHDIYRNGWRSTTQTYGYDLVQLNHYAVRSAESFLVKRDRGRVNHVDRDQGLAYWFRMNNNAERDDSIEQNLSMMYAELSNLMADPEIAQAHAAAVTAHRAKISDLRSSPKYEAFFEQITSGQMEKLSRLHSHFGANVFLAGPQSVPESVADRDPEQDWFFTVDPQEKTAH